MAFTQPSKIMHSSQVTGKVVKMVTTCTAGSQILSEIKYLTMTKTEQLFEEVIQILHSRGSQYGHPIGNHKRIAKLWSAYLNYPIQPNEVAILMCLLKISRQAEDPRVDDNYKDALGYISIAKTITDAMQDEDGAWSDGI